MPRKSQSAEQLPELSPEEQVPAEQAEASPPAPPFYIAQRPLYLHGDGGMGVVAFAEGDRVPPEHVERFGWHDYVTDPFAAPQPAVSEGEYHTAPLASPGAEQPAAQPSEAGQQASETGAQAIPQAAAEPAEPATAEPGTSDEAAPAAQEE